MCAVDADARARDGPAYPSRACAQALVTETLKLEEDALPARRWSAACPFSKKKAAASSVAINSKAMSPSTLYDTFRFPLDLTQDALRPRGVSG